MNHKIIYYFIASLSALLYLLAGCVPVSSSYQSASQKKLLYDDVNYEPVVGMVQLYPHSHTHQPELENPVLSIGHQQGLMLTFDLLEENYSYISARYIHCNSDWRPSGLADIRFLDTYNQFTIDQYNYSANTKNLYVQYAANLPNPTISGNYILVVYRGNNPDDILFTRRFLVFENNARISTSIGLSSNIAQRASNQQIDFAIRYSNINSINALQDFKVILLQNHRWETAITDLQPTLVRQDQDYLEYHHFNTENNFSGLNEFRFFDLRSVDYRGMNVAAIQKHENSIDAYLGQDRSRRELAYTQINEDLNGKFYLQNTDPSDTQLQSEYVNVHFALSARPVDGNVYIMGRYNNWRKENEMIYDTVSNSYKGSVLLKQGYYDYIYWVVSPELPGSYFEGAKYQTENEYEILFYYRDPANNFDELIGYKRFLSNN